MSVSIDGVMKICSNCGENRSVDCFCKCKRRTDGLNPSCRICAKEYYEKNKEEKKKKGNIYREKNKEILKERRRLHYKNNKEKLNAISRAYYRAHKDEARAYGKEYKKNNKEKILIHRKKYNKDRHKPSKSSYLFSLIPIVDKPEFDSEGYITVVCKFDDKRFRPSAVAITSRLLCVKGVIGGECNFYCSDACVDACPLHRFRPDIMTDPRSDLYIIKSEQEEARRCQTDHLKILQIDEFGYNFCEKCGSEVNTVELHHTLPVAQFGLEAINSAGHLLVCNDCHKEFTKDCKI